MPKAMPIRVQCEPLTPVWTGDVERKGIRTRETGLIGSLRWWYEAILRGSGFYACDPSFGTCLYSDEHKLEGICLACQLFGCTGYSRRFRLEIEGGGRTGELSEILLENPGVTPHRGWRIPKSVTNPFTLKFIPLFPHQDMDSVGLGLTLRFIERYGAFAAKTSHGQGVVQFANILEPQAPTDWANKLQQKRKKNAPTGQAYVPDIRDFVGVTINITPSQRNWWQSLPVRNQDLRAFGLSVDSRWLPSAPVIRAMLRSELRNEGISTDDRHRLMGTLKQWGDPKREKNGGKDRTKGSDIFVTHFYRANDLWRMRIFGFVSRSGVADQSTRTLLANPTELKNKIADVLKLNQNEITSVTPYPSSIEGLLAGLGAPV